MKKLLAVALSFLTVTSFGLAASTPVLGNNSQDSSTTRKRGPVFRATKEQINQAQAVLKGRGFYAGEPTGKLDGATRDGLKKYQAAENIRVTGTLNRLTLERMGIVLTDKQKGM